MHGKEQNGKTRVFNNHREKNLKNKSFPGTHLIKANVDTDCHQELSSVQRKSECIESLHSRDHLGKPHVETPTPTQPKFRNQEQTAKHIRV